MNFYNFEFQSIDGETLPLATFREKAVLVVNTASLCGYTPQYAGLQTLWTRYRDRGLVVLGVPSNDFGEQEPENETAIKAFCTRRYEVDFPMTTKQAVIGGSAHPFFGWVEGLFGEALTPRWNFHKFLVGKDGELAGAWPSKVDPLDEEITSAVESALTGDNASG